MRFKFEYTHVIEIMGDTLFESCKGQFLTTGMLSRAFLKCLWSSFNLSDDELEGMIELLKANNHCFEHKQKDENNPFTLSSSLLRFPWFIKTQELSKSFWKYDWPDNVPYGHLELTYVYTFFRRLPSTLYERISVRLQHLFQNQPDSRREDWVDGVYIQTGRMKLLIQRLTYLQNPQLVVKLRAPSRDLFLLWKLCLDSYFKVVDKLVEQSTVVTYKKDYVCPHCTLTGRSKDSAHKLPLGEVMKSRCEEQYDVLCPNADISGQKHVAIPAAFLRPVIDDGKENDHEKMIRQRHLETVEQFCTASTEDVLMNNLAEHMCDNEKLISVGIHLGIPDHKIRVHRTNDQSSITKAAYDMLVKWLSEQRQEGITEEDLEDKLKTAFIKAGLNIVTSRINLTETKRITAEQKEISTITSASGSVHTHKNAKSRDSKQKIIQQTKVNPTATSEKGSKSAGQNSSTGAGTSSTSKQQGTKSAHSSTKHKTTATPQSTRKAKPATEPRVTLKGSSSKIGSSQQGTETSTNSTTKHSGRSVNKIIPSRVAQFDKDSPEHESIDTSEAADHGETMMQSGQCIQDSSLKGIQKSQAAEYIPDGAGQTSFYIPTNRDPVQAARGPNVNPFSSFGTDPYPIEKATARMGSISAGYYPPTSPSHSNPDFQTRYTNELTQGRPEPNSLTDSYSASHITSGQRQLDSYSQGLASNIGMAQSDYFPMRGGNVPGGQMQFMENQFSHQPQQYSQMYQGTGTSPAIQRSQHMQNHRPRGYIDTMGQYNTSYNHVLQPPLHENYGQGYSTRPIPRTGSSHSLPSANLMRGTNANYQRTPYQTEYGLTAPTQPVHSIQRREQLVHGRSSGRGQDLVTMSKRMTLWDRESTTSGRGIKDTSVQPNNE